MRHLLGFVKLFTSHGVYYAGVRRLLLLRALSKFLHYYIAPYRAHMAYRLHNMLNCKSFLGIALSFSCRTPCSTQTHLS